MTRQSLNRELMALQAAGIVSHSYARITLRDLVALNQMAGAEQTRWS